MSHHWSVGPTSVSVLTRPTAHQLGELADSWNLHPVLRDALYEPHQPKCERYDDVLYLCLRATQYLDQTEAVELSSVQLLQRGTEVVLVLPEGKWLDGQPFTGTFEQVPADLQAVANLGPGGFIYWLTATLTDGFHPVLDGLELDLEQIESQVFNSNVRVSERIYRLSREVIELQHAVGALGRILPHLEDLIGQLELTTFFSDLEHELARASHRGQALRDSLSQILSVNATLVAERQNDDMKKISGWAAILFAPTLVAAIYGMNFTHMPELHWVFGYPLAVALMVVFSVVLYTLFKRKDWL